MWTGQAQLFNKQEELKHAGAELTNLRSAKGSQDMRWVEEQARLQGDGQAVRHAEAEIQESLQTTNAISLLRGTSLASALHAITKRCLSFRVKSTRYAT